MSPKQNPNETQDLDGAEQRTSRTGFSLDPLHPDADGLDAPMPKSTGLGTDNTDENTRHLGRSDSSGGEESGEGKLGKGDRIGRYRLLGQLGEGGYGRVFHAFDEQLQRNVAIKVPHRSRIVSEQSVEQYLAEARTLAKLKHPRIVAVHDVLVADDGVPCIVSDYVDGTSLASRMQSDPMSLREGLQVLVEMGTALAYVHSKGVVHRDVKPGNILLGKDGQAYLADFGLALNASSFDSPGMRIGTPAYMSPEQARGEGHLVDGRSDLFSLGVILFEMLTGRRPFGNHHRQAIYERLQSQDAPPPRQLNASVPRELERICLKALAKQASHRYASAADWVEDLECFLTSEATVTDEHLSQSRQAASVTVASDAPGVIPRGLQAYDRYDRGFFSQLLSGPSDRDGVPESLRFWQRQIEQVDQVDPLRVGVIYGPSGCGKSSFIKAGLLPLLSSTVNSIFVEATRDATEDRLLRQLLKRHSELPTGLGIAETLGRIRQRESVKPTQRLLIVIDQFEQWLHGRTESESLQLASALRQCDGSSIQCVLLVRDDFWLALARFMSLLEIPLKQNVNTSLLDLFSRTHAKDVLHRLGAGYDKLPHSASELNAEQTRFIDQAVEELSEGGKVYPVQLALFVEMIKSEPWTPATLQGLGGVRGIGFRFLDESFSGALAPAAQRVHEHAVRRVLRYLLPDTGVSIKGNMQPESVLMDASGYEESPAQFFEMMRILEIDLRLISPTDPMGVLAADETQSGSVADVCHYQLTHDFLVPAIEEWLTRSQQETRRGRAELRLSEYASLWSSKPEPRYAPTWLDWVSICWQSDQDRWNKTERKMMKAATRYHLLRSFLWAAVLMVGMFSIVWIRGRSEANGLVAQLQTSQVQNLPSLIDGLRQCGTAALSPLREGLANPDLDPKEKWRNRLAIQQIEGGDAKSLVNEALGLPPSACQLVGSYLRPLDDDAIEILVGVLGDATTDGPRQLRAAILAAVGAETTAEMDSIVAQRRGEIVDAMLQQARVSPQDSQSLIVGLRPLRRFLNDALLERATQPGESPGRSLATSFLTQFLAEEPERLLQFFFEASFDQQATLLPTLEPFLKEQADDLLVIVHQEPDSDVSEQQFDIAARRRGTAAALLHRLGKPESTWGLFRLREWPHARGYLINRIAPLGGNFEVLMNRITRESDVSSRRGLLMAMGGFDSSKLKSSVRESALVLVRDAFKNDPDTGTHSVAEWLLRKWGESKMVDDYIASQTSSGPEGRKNWFINKHGFTMAVLDGRDVPGIGRRFAISTKEVTVEQYLKYNPDHPYFAERSPTPDCPVGLLSWHRCVGYCRWLNAQFGIPEDGVYPEVLGQRGGKADYQHVIEHASYRLPTSEEWTFACASSTTSRRYYGLSDDLSDDYYWHYDTTIQPNRVLLYRPGGAMPPNDYGLFAMYDGVREWCHGCSDERCEIAKPFSHMEKMDAQTNPKTVEGGFLQDIAIVSNGYYGCRIAQTLPDGD